MKKRKIILGITGPISSGKNEVCKVLEQHGAFVIDADKIGHEVIKEESVRQKITDTFGKDILLKNGGIDRKKLGEKIFRNHVLLKKLNRITHPEILKKVEERISASRAKLIIVNAAILKEIGISRLVDSIWVVLADRKIRIQRLMRNKGMTRSQAAARVKVQMSDSEYKRDADKVIENNGSLKELKKKVSGLAAAVL